MARRANTSADTVSRYENGWRRFEMYTLGKLATSLGCRLRVELEPIEEQALQAAHPGAIRKLRRLFWDRPLRKQDLEDDPRRVTQRVLEYGTLEDVRMLITMMGRERFLEEVARVRFSSRKTGQFWEAMLKREGIPCVKKFSRQEARSCWPG